MGVQSRDEKEKAEWEEAEGGDNSCQGVQRGARKVVERESQR